jgi:hypothetical protein
MTNLDKFSREQSSPQAINFRRLFHADLCRFFLQIGAEKGADLRRIMETDELCFLQIFFLRYLR